MNKTIYLHIGIGKTGTSSIQELLYKKRDELLKHNILYPLSGLYAYAHHRLANMKDNEFNDHDTSLYHELKGEIESSGCDVIVISSENFSFVKPGYVSDLQKQLCEFNVKIVLYARNQEQLIQSTYLEFMKAGWNYRSSLEEFFDWHSRSFDFMIRLEPWIKYFGIENIKVRLFDPSIIGHNVQEDFVKICNIDKVVKSFINEKANPSILPDFELLIKLVDLKSNKQDIENELNRLNKIFSYDFSEIFKCEKRSEMINTLLQHSVEFKKCSNTSLIDDRLRIKILKKYKKSNFEFAQLFLSEEETSCFLRDYDFFTIDNDVLIGQNGWLYLYGGSNHVYKYYTENSYFTSDICKSWKDLLCLREHRLKQMDIKYVHLFVPDKITVYPEYLPIGFKYIENNNPIKKLFSDHNKDIQHFCIDPTNFLHTIKEEQEIYWKTDTHWNFHGAFSAFQLILDKLNYDLPKYFSATPLKGKKLYLDLGSKLTAKRDELFKTVNFIHNATRVFANNIVEYKEKNTNVSKHHFNVGSNVIYRNDNPEAIQKKVLIFGDSFSEYRPHLLTGLFAETFMEVHFVWSISFDYEYIKNYQPDLIIGEIAERFMKSVPIDKFNLKEFSASKLNNTSNAKNCKQDVCKDIEPNNNRSHRVIKRAVLEFDKTNNLRIDHKVFRDPFNKDIIFNLDRIIREPDYLPIFCYSNAKRENVDSYLLFLVNLKDITKLIVWKLDANLIYIKQNQVSINEFYHWLQTYNEKPSIDASILETYSSLPQFDVFTLHVNNLQDSYEIFKNNEYSWELKTLKLSDSLIWEIFNTTLESVNISLESLFEDMKYLCENDQEYDTILTLWKKILIHNAPFSSIEETADDLEKRTGKWFAKIMSVYKYFTLRESFSFITGNNVVLNPISGYHVRSSKSMHVTKTKNDINYRIFYYEIENGDNFYEVRDYGYLNQTNALIFSDNTLGFVMPKFQPASFYHPNNLHELSEALQSFDSMPYDFEKKQCLFVNMSSQRNLGHYLWNDLSAYHASSEYLHDIPNLNPLIYWFKPYSKSKFSARSYSDILVDDLVKLISSKSDSTLFTEESFEMDPSQYKALSIKSLGLSTNFAQSIQKILLKSCNKSNTNINNLQNFNILLNVRVHNKACLNLFECCKYFLEKYSVDENLSRNISFYLEGTEEALSDITALQEMISSFGYDAAKFIDCDIDEYACIVQSSDVVIAPVGSGMVIPTWIFDKYILAHGDHRHMDQIQFWDTVGSICTADKIHSIPNEYILCEEDKMYSSYNLDEDFFSNKLMHILNIINSKK